MQIIKGKKLLPKKIGKWKRKKKYNYDQLDIGDCLFVEGKKEGYSAATSARSWGYKNNRIFTARFADGGVYTYRLK